jgi:hypothetical protein
VFFTDDDRRLRLKALAEEDREALSDPRLHTNRGRPAGSARFAAIVGIRSESPAAPASRRPAEKKDENG